MRKKPPYDDREKRKIKKQSNRSADSDDPVKPEIDDDDYEDWDPGSFD